MTQTSAPNASTDLFTRFKAWVLAMPVEVDPTTDVDSETDNEGTPAAQRDDSFYLSLGLYGHL